MEKKTKLLLLQIVGYTLSAYMIVNLTLYVMRKIPHIVFWGSLILLAILSIKIIPTIRAKIENS